MRASKQLGLSVIACIAMCAASLAAAAESDQMIAERVLGPQWRQLSQRAGMAFVGTVLKGETRPAGTDRTPSSIDFAFKVDRAIAGVEPGQILTIHEWTGATSLHRPLRTGERVLLFLYPPSRLGFTSPVGGSQGQITIDGTKKTLDQLQRAIRAARAQQIGSSRPGLSERGE